MVLHLCGAVKASFLAVMGKRLLVSFVFVRIKNKEAISYPCQNEDMASFIFVLFINLVYSQMASISYASINPLAFNTVAISC